MESHSVRRLRVLDGLYYSFRLLDHYQEELYPACCRIRQDPGAAVIAIAAAWGFIDALHRARELAQLMPGLSRRRPELVKFLKATHLAEKYRHYIQHLRSELASAESSNHPVWGSLSWVDPATDSLSHTVMIGSLPPGTQTQFSGASYDTVRRRWGSRVCLGIREASLDFDPVYEGARAFEAFVIPWALQCGGITPVAAEKLPIATVRIQVLPEPPNKGIQVPAGEDEPGDSDAGGGARRT